MKPPMLHIHYDAESDYLEIRFGLPTVSYYEKIDADTYVRKDEQSGEVKGYALFNVRKIKHPLKGLDLEIPLSVLKSLEEQKSLS